ncbi:hypothetical protein C1645_872269 [Glomus cerebriforme]|uniref:SHSP domain-containing protein n=1 Tax=Glomus cerebriforme TaxID=658196 RepID=A0A397TD07_9GLOM|nr:hypothetical protein C1645_872269 [Glomus cerebriforme]
MSSQLQLQTSEHLYNLFETSDKFIIYLQIPGVKKEDFNIGLSLCNTNIVYFKFKYDIIEEFGNCLKRNFCFPKDEVFLKLDLPKYINPDEEATVEFMKGIAMIVLTKVIDVKLKRLRIKYDCL